MSYLPFPRSEPTLPVPLPPPGPERDQLFLKVLGEHAPRGRRRPRDFEDNPALESPLTESLTRALDDDTRLEQVYQALWDRLPPSRVTACLLEAGIHPMRVALRAKRRILRQAIAAFLSPPQEHWRVSHQAVHFTGETLPPGLRLTDALHLEGCPGELSLPADLCTPHLVLKDCLELREIPTLPRGVRGLTIEHAPMLERLPEFLSLGGNLVVDAAPRLLHMPHTIEAETVSVRHCPGLTRWLGNVTCDSLELGPLIHLRELNLDLNVRGGRLELDLPALHHIRGRWMIRTDLVLRCPALEDLRLDLKAGGFLLVEHARKLRAMEGHMNLGGGLTLHRNPELRRLPQGSVKGMVDFQDLPSVREVPASLLSDSRMVRMERCGLEALPEDARFCGGLSLVDLPGLQRWPERMEVGILTILGCPHLPEVPEGVVVRTALRRARPEDRADLDAQLRGAPTSVTPEVLSLRTHLRALITMGPTLAEAVAMLQAGGHDSGEVLVAARLEGYDLRAFLEACYGLMEGGTNLAAAARACLKGGVHPASLALVERDRIKARWLAELLSDSADLARGLGGDGTLTIGKGAKWDLPEGLAVPGSIHVKRDAGRPRWPKGLVCANKIHTVEDWLRER